MRVGEASNPGPKGNSDADSALASALLEVLKSWKRPSGPGGSRSPDAHDAVRSENGKGEGKSAPTPGLGSSDSHGLVSRPTDADAPCCHRSEVV